MSRSLVRLGILAALASLLLAGCVNVIPSTSQVVATPTTTESKLVSVQTVPSPTAIPSPTVPPPTVTPVPSPTTVVKPTRTVGPPTLTPTATKPAAPAAPTSTPVPPAPATPYTFQDISWLPNCGMIQILISVKDASGNPIDGVVVRYETVDGMNTARSNPTGSKGAGLTDFTVNPVGMLAATWRVWIVDGSDTPQSAKVNVTSNTEDCTGGGHQIATVNFKKN